MLVDLLTKMLEFNPYFRPSARQLLSSPLFDTFRVPEIEKIPNSKIKMKFDKEFFMDLDPVNEQST